MTIEETLKSGYERANELAGAKLAVVKRAVGLL
jgi:hypothetical protein